MGSGSDLRQDAHLTSNESPPPGRTHAVDALAVLEAMAAVSTERGGQSGGLVTLSGSPAGVRVRLCPSKRQSLSAQVPPPPLRRNLPTSTHRNLLSIDYSHSLPKSTHRNLLSIDYSHSLPKSTHRNLLSILTLILLLQAHTETCSQFLTLILFLQARLPSPFPFPSRLLFSSRRSFESTCDL